MGTVREPSGSYSPRTVEILSRHLVWDNHGCMPLRPDDVAFLPQLSRYRNAGVDVVSLNVGFDAVQWDNTLAMLSVFRGWLAERPLDYTVIESVADIEAARASGKLGVTFDIEGGSALNGDLRMVEHYYQLGVRWMLMAYNRNNLLGGGCNDDDGGLTAFGRDVVDEVARVGMVVCCTHCGIRTSMDVMERSTKSLFFLIPTPLGYGGIVAISAMRRSRLARGRTGSSESTATASFWAVMTPPRRHLSGTSTTSCSWSDRDTLGSPSTMYSTNRSLPIM